MEESVSEATLHADSSEQDVIAHIQQQLDQLKAERGTLRVLEAGCGSASVLRFGDDDWMAGIDISEEQLARNTRLNEAILGDICAYELEDEGFDVIVCWNVLEHLDKPDLAVLNFARALKPGGLLLLALPNVYSFQGAVVRFSPHWFHVWFVRNIFGRTWAGRDGKGPFPTFLRRSASPLSMARFPERSALKLSWSLLYEGNQQTRFRRKYPVLSPFFRSLDVVDRLTGDAVQPRLSASAFIFTK